jgi:hypothetical protein
MLRPGTVRMLREFKPEEAIERSRAIEIGNTQDDQI